MTARSFAPGERRSAHGERSAWAGPPRTSVIGVRPILACVVAISALGALATRAIAVPRACHAPSLRASLGGQGATQSLVDSLTVTNRGTVACRLRGRPAISFRADAPRPALVETASRAGVAGPRARFALVLAAGHSARVFLQWRNWCTRTGHAVPTSSAAGGPRPTLVMVRLTSHARPIAVAVRGGLARLYLPVCDAPRAPSTLAVSGWSPAG